MSVAIELIEGPLPPAESWGVEGAGALLIFEGIVRPTEEGRELAALVYEAYPPMTEQELTRLAERTAEEHGLLAFRVEHSTGRVPVAACSFRLWVASRHRAEGIAATDAFIREMKRDVPLWKVAEYQS
ncbi:Molybdopterin synthase catalytic subunit [Planctomycetes bacterium MalM25]|nr:Molybdopterin synthase catalytic subunit [Planctomycetes bacterium MalM25]